MKFMFPILAIILFSLLFGCASESPMPTAPDEPHSPEPEQSAEQEVPSYEEETEPLDEEAEEELVQDPEDEQVEEEVQVIEPSVPSVDPQSDPKVLVDTYLSHMTRAIDGNDAAFADAYSLIALHSIKNLPYLANLERYKYEAGDTYGLFDIGRNITGFLEVEEFGTGSYRVHYSFEGGEFDGDEVFYTVTTFNDLLWVTAGSKRGSLFWRMR